MNIHRKTYILIILIILLQIFCSKNISAKKAPKASKGVIDLSNWDFEKQGNIDLNGKWEFYWNQLLSYDDFYDNKPDKLTGFISVPGLWNGYVVNYKKLNGIGHATYKLKVKLKNKNQVYALKVLNAATSINIYINKKLISSSGHPGINKKNTISGYYPKVSTFEVDTNIIDIIVHVSNYQHKKGGIWEEIKLGTETQIRSRRTKNLAFEFFLIGSILIMGLYHLVLFIIRKNDKSSLYFSLFCFILPIRISVTGEQFIHYIINIDWQFMVKIEYISLYLALPFFMMFVRSLYPNEFPKIVVRITQVVCLLYSIIVLFTPVRVYSHYMLSYQIITIAGGIYTIWILINADIYKREGALLFLFAWFFLFLTVLNDILFQNDIIHTGNFAFIGLLIFIFSQAVVLSSRFSKAFYRIEKLFLSSKNLQEIVIEKTNETNKQKEDINLKNIELEKLNDNLEKTEEKFKVLYELSKEAHLILDRNRILDCNTAALKLFQCDDKDKLLTIHPGNLSPENQLDNSISTVRIEELIDYAYKNGKHNFQWVLQKFDKTVITVEVTLNLINLPDKEALLVTFYTQ